MIAGATGMVGGSALRYALDNPAVEAVCCSSVDLRKYTPAVADQLLHLSAHLLDASIQASNELLASSRVRLRIVLRAPKDDVEENGNEVQALLG